MKIPFNKIKLDLPPERLLLTSGYAHIYDRQSGEDSYVRRLGGGYYPRFHVYINDDCFNMHLDQKQASYENSARHSAEYDSDLVMEEAGRIRQVIVEHTQSSAMMEKLAEPSQNYPKIVSFERDLEELSKGAKIGGWERFKKLLGL